MSEFKENKENKGIEGILKDVVEHGHGFAMVSIEGVEQVSIAHVINPFPCEELGDDFPIENHISPNCKVEELQTLYTQQGINMFKLQKRVDKAIRLLVEAELYQSEPNIDLAVKALNGEGSD